VQSYAISFRGMYGVGESSFPTLLAIFANILNAEKVVNRKKLFSLVPFVKHYVFI